MFKGAEDVYSDLITSLIFELSPEKGEKCQEMMVPRQNRGLKRKL